MASVQYDIHLLSARDRHTDPIRARLQLDIPHEEGRRLREQLKNIAAEFYAPQHSLEDYFSYMNRHACSFTVNGPQSKNHPYYWTMFSEPSQHVMGDCVEECLDKALKLERVRAHAK